MTNEYTLTKDEYVNVLTEQYEAVILENNKEETRGVEGSILVQFPDLVVASSFVSILENEYQAMVDLENETNKERVWFRSQPVKVRIYFEPPF